MILADNGSNWYVSGRAEPALVERPATRARVSLTGADFEVVDTSKLRP